MTAQYKREQYLRELGYNIDAQGMITDLGKFEGENYWAPYFYGIVLDGFSESLTDGLDIVDINGEDQQMFPELSKDTVAMAIETSDQGFVYVTELNADKLAKLQAAYIESDESGED